MANLPSILSGVVRFEQSDPHDGGQNKIWIVVRAEGELTWQIGIKPGVWAFTVAAEDFDAMVNFLGSEQKLLGDLCFYHDAPPAADIPSDALPQLRIKNCRIVDVQPGVYGYPAGGGAIAAITYRIFIADFRWKLEAPFAAIVVSGVFNQQPVVAGIDKNGFAVLNTWQMFEQLLAKIPFDVEIDVAPAKRKTPILYDVKFNGVSVSRALDELLRRSGCVLVPNFDGSAKIQRAGDGQAPALPASQAMPILPTPGFNIRPSACVVTCAKPIDTITARGIGNYGDFEYVMQKPSTGQWETVEQFGTDNSLLPLEWLHTGSMVLRDVPRPDAWNQLYRCIRLRAASLIDRKMLRRASNSDGSEGDIKVEARIAVKDEKGGAWSQPAGRVRCTMAGLLDDGQVIFVGQRLVKLPAGSSGIIDPWPRVQPLGEGGGDANEDLAVTFSQESAAPLQIGYRRQGDVVVEYTSAGDIAALNADGARQISRPDLELRRVNGIDQNLNAIKDQAREAAEHLISPPRFQAMTLGVVGFTNADLSAVCPRVQISQLPPKMMYSVGSAFGPSLGMEVVE